MKYIYILGQRLVAYLLLISFLLQSCSHPSIQPEVHKLEEVDFISGKFECREDKEGANNTLILSAPPYRPVATPQQSAQIYQGELQTLPYDNNRREETVLMKSGEDGRTRIEKTTQWPYLFHSQLEMKFAGEDDTYGGSGILVGPQHILTAGHNVYDYKFKKGWAQRVVARLGLNDNLAPYGGVLAKRMYTFKGWTNQGETGFDMALLVLDRPIGYNTGWCGLLAATTQDLQSHRVNITGYPGDKGFKQMWSMGDRLKQVQDEELIYEIDTYGGQSGSGIWIDKWGSPYVIGVHTKGGNPLANIGNSGVRLSHKKAKQVIAWINETLSFKDKIKELPFSLLSEVTIDALALEAKNGNKEALIRLLDASQVKNAYVQLVLGRLYEEGVGVAKDLKQAFSFYQQSAEQCNGEAQYRLGEQYEKGLIGEKDDKKAVIWYERAADQGHTKAKSSLEKYEKRYAAPQYNLGLMYRDGEGIAQDYKKAVKWFEKAADQGDADAQFNLGVMYKDGQGVVKDSKKAVEWYQRAADQGHAPAQIYLGVMYENGEGVAKDAQKAVEWYQKAAAQGNAAAQNNLGVMYENGEGVDKDAQKAVEWYQKAAAQGNASAQFNLGVMYDNGQGVDKDAQKAVEWYQKAAAQGNAAAQNNLGVMYRNGEGVAKDAQKAVEWYQKAAAQGHATAQVNLGVMYENGEGVAKDAQKAVEWYQKAAAQGNAAAQFNLGWMYENGEGVAQDYKKAVEWYQKAAAQGHATAQNNLDRINSTCIIS